MTEKTKSSCLEKTTWKRWAKSTPILKEHTRMQNFTCGIVDGRHVAIPTSIQESQKPQRNSPLRAELDVVRQDVRVWNILYLLAFFVFPADFKSVFLVDEKIALLGKQDFMIVRQLVESERFTHIADVRFGFAEQEHQVRVFQKNLVGLLQRSKSTALLEDLVNQF